MEVDVLRWRGKGGVDQHEREEKWEQRREGRTSTC